MNFGNVSVGQAVGSDQYLIFTVWVPTCIEALELSDAASTPASSTDLRCSEGKIGRSQA